MERHRIDERALMTGAHSLFDIFRRETRELRERAETCRKIFMLEDPEMAGAPHRPATPQLHTLKSTIVGCVADQMDNTPEALILPERAELAEVAEDLRDIIRYILEQNAFDRLHKLRASDYFQTGTSVIQVVWDEKMNGGQGEVALLRCPVESFYWDPCAEDIQQSRALFKASFHPQSWYEQHYPEQAGGIEPDRFSIEERMDHSRVSDLSDDEPQILLLEYWYRRYDAASGRYAIHVAYIAGGVVLYASERERPQGVYAHGLYPFVLDVYTPIEGTPVGNGMVWEFAPMQRYINRYARYIDENARMSAKVRLLVSSGAGLDEEALTDWNANVIRGDNISESALRWFQSQPLSGQVNAQMASFEQQIKLDSGQNQFSRGEAGMGVTAASAIVALQEAGGKTARLHTSTLGEGFREIVGQMLWLIAQCYDERRTRLITGRGGEAARQIQMGRGRMMGGQGKGIMPPPPYVAQVQIQRHNPLRVQAQNEFVLQMAQMAAGQGTPLPVEQVLNLLQVEGKERILPALQGLGEQME